MKKWLLSLLLLLSPVFLFILPSDAAYVIVCNSTGCTGVGIGAGGGAGTGDIDSVTAGAGLTGGGTSGAVTLDVAVTAPIALVGDTIGCPTCGTGGVGTITGVTAGAGLTGGGTTGTVTLDIGGTAPIVVGADAISCPTCALLPINLAGGSGVVTGILPNANTTATSANTASTIVARDGSGNFAAGTITAALSGNATSATTATTAATATTATTATTAGALTTNPIPCPANQVVTDIAADGTLTCNPIIASQVPYSASGSLTAGNVQAAIDELEVEKSPLPLNGATAPSASTVRFPGDIHKDTRAYNCVTSEGLTYIGFGLGGNFTPLAAESDGYVQISDGTNAIAPCGADALRIARASTLATEVELFSKTVAFTNQPSNDTVEIISSTADTAVVTVYGNTNAGDPSDITIETITLNGTTPVASTKVNWSNILAWKKPATTGTITLRKGTTDATISTLAPASLRSSNQDTLFIKASGGITFQDEGSNLAAQPIVNFTGTPATCTSGGGKITCDFTSGSVTIGTLSQFRPANNEPPPTLFAGYSTRNSHPILTFVDGSDTSAVFSDTMPRHYLNGNLNVRIRFSSTVASANPMNWCAAFERIATGGLDIDGNDFAADQCISQAANATSGVTQVATIPFTQVQADSVAAADGYRLKITRDGDGTSGTDSNTGVGEILLVEVYQ